MPSLYSAAETDTVRKRTSLRLTPTRNTPLTHCPHPAKIIPAASVPFSIDSSTGNTDKAGVPGLFRRERRAADRFCGPLPPARENMCAGGRGTWSSPQLRSQIGHRSTDRAEAEGPARILSELHTLR